MGTGEDTVYQVVFELLDQAIIIEVRGDEFILEAARRQGVDFPSLCEQGWCITCAVKVLSGRVDQSASVRYYEQDRQAGFALICTGRPCSDLRLRPGAVEEMRLHRDAHRLPVPRGTHADRFGSGSQEQDGPLCLVAIEEEKQTGGRSMITDFENDNVMRTKRAKR